MKNNYDEMKKTYEKPILTKSGALSVLAAYTLSECNEMGGTFRNGECELP